MPAFTYPHARDTFTAASPIAVAHVVGERGRGALLDQLLVAALRRAVALAEPDAVAVRVGEHLHLDVARPREVALDVALAAPEALQRLGLRGLERARRFGRASWTTRMPRPPPPNAALMATGQPCDSPNATTSSADVRNSVVPGTPATPAASAARRDDTLSPMISIASGGGPTNTTPLSLIARAKSVFSEKNP